MESVYIKAEPVPHTSTSEPPLETQQLCRLCANVAGRAVQIYGDEGLSNQLSDRINEYLPVKVSPGDKLTLYCCRNCMSALLTFHTLVVVCVEAEKRLQSNAIEAAKPALPLAPETVAVPEFDDDDEDEEMIDAELEEEVEPDNDEEDEESEEETKPIPSTSDDTEAMAEWDAASLNAFCHSALNKNEPAPKTGSEISKLKSAWSKDEDPTEDSILANLLNEKSGEVSEPRKGRSKANEADVDVYKYLCQFCSSEFVSEEEALSHINAEHSGETTEQTPIKKERRKHTKIDQELINSAKVIVEGKIYYNCKTCGKSLHSPYTYIWHMRIHTGERPFVCDLCGKQFRVSQGLVRHLKETHEGIKNYPCDLCGRMFATRRNVEEHRRIHTNERPYICDLCGKAFKQKASLFVHNRSHTNYFPFRCSYCNQGFRTRPTLLIHVTRHTGEKPYPCDVCGRCFRIKYELKRHKLIHSDEKPFACDECGVTFRQKRYLRNHAKSNHNREIS